MRGKSGKQSCWESASYPAQGEPCCNTTAGHKFSLAVGKNEGSEGVTGRLEEQNNVSCLIPLHATPVVRSLIGEFRKRSQE